MIRIINWLKGYVRLLVTGKSTERFLNLCSHKNILLWDIVRCNDDYELNISIKAFKSLLPIVYKTKVKVVVRQRMGLPFFVENMNKRRIFLLGAMIAVFIWQISGNFLWRIEINGNIYITEEQINDYLKEKNVKLGTLKSKIEIEDLEKELRINFPQIKWISGKLNGTTLCIDIKEAETFDESVIFEEGIRYDMLSSKEGIVDSIIVRKGVPKVKQGDTVQAGNVLVEGIIPILNDDGSLREERYVKSDADILIRYQLDFNEALNEKYVKKQYTGRYRKIPYFRIGEVEIVLGNKPNYLITDTVVSENTAEFIDELSLPVKWGSINYREYQNIECYYSKDEAASILSNKFLKFLDTLSEKGVQIIEKDVKIKKSGDIWYISGKLTVSEPVNTWVSYDNSNKEINGEIE